MPYTFHSHRTAADGSGSQKIRSRRSIAFNKNHTWTLVALTAEYDETLPILAFNLDAKARHHRQSDLDIWLGNQFSNHLDLDRLASQRQRHQQTRQKLARYISAYLHRIACQIRRRNPQRREAFIAQIADVRAQLAQRIHQITDGTLVHAPTGRTTGSPEHFITSARQCQCSYQRAKRRAGVTEKKLRLFDREVSTTSCNAISIVTQRFHFHAQCSQCIQHAFSIIGMQQVAHFCHTFGQRRQQQHAIRNTLGAGQAHNTVRRHQGREFKKFVLSHVTLSRFRHSGVGRNPADLLNMLLALPRVVGNDFIV